MVGKTVLMSTVLVVGLTGQAVTMSADACDVMSDIGDILYDTAKSAPKVEAKDLGGIAALGLKLSHPEFDMDKLMDAMTIVGQFVIDHKKGSKKLVRAQLYKACRNGELLD